MTPLQELTEEETKRAWAAVEAWWVDKAKSQVSCFACGKETLKVENLSVPPHAEWYDLSCGACGRTARLHRPAARSRYTEDI